jgi:hypothetical protein
MAWPVRDRYEALAVVSNCYLHALRVAYRVQLSPPMFARGQAGETHGTTKRLVSKEDSFVSRTYAFPLTGCPSVQEGLVSKEVILEVRGASHDAFSQNQGIHFEEAVATAVSP